MTSNFLKSFYANFRKIIVFILHYHKLNPNNLKFFNFDNLNSDNFLNFYNFNYPKYPNLIIYNFKIHNLFTFHLF